MMCVLKDYEIMAEHDGTSATANVSSFISRDNTVLVGANGKRFVDEKDSGYMTQKLNGPVFDQMHRDGLGYVWAISDQASLDEKGVKRGLDMEFVVADTFEELAEKMGLDAAALSETPDQLQRLLRRGARPGVWPPQAGEAQRAVLRGSRDSVRNHHLRRHCAQ